MIQKITDYLKAHPWLAGLVQAIEGALAGAATSILTDWTTGGYTWNKAGLEKMATFVVVSVGIAIRNYLKQPPRKEWTPTERAANTGGSNVIAETTTVTIDKSSTATAGSKPTP